MKNLTKEQIESKLIKLEEKKQRLIQKKKQIAFNEAADSATKLLNKIDSIDRSRKTFTKKEIVGKFRKYFPLYTYNEYIMRNIYSLAEDLGIKIKE